MAALRLTLMLASPCLRSRLTTAPTECSPLAVHYLERQLRSLRGSLCRRALWIIGTASPAPQERGTRHCSIPFIGLPAVKHPARPPVGIVQWPKARRDRG